ncbi:MAG: PQQ-binding-like beta-propeller repeat protein [Verrucomicrobiota bacterium]
MVDANSTKVRIAQPGIRWWPAILFGLIAAGLIVWVRWQEEWPFQKRNLTTAQVIIVTGMLLLLWWTFVSRAPKPLRLAVTFGLVGAALLCAALFRLRGTTGDLYPIIEFRWAKPLASPPSPIVPPASAGAVVLHGEETTNAFPQYLGPDRNGVLTGPRLETNWIVHPPQTIWRRPIGAAWSGFAVVGNLCLTQEQRDGNECVVACDLTTGQTLWSHSDPARYNTTIAGEGPRATPTIVSNRVFTFGATGVLNCFDLRTGRLWWTHDVVAETQAKVLPWGCTSSPLVVNDLVVVHGGEGAGRSLFAYRIEDGKPAWAGGSSDASYASPVLATLAGLTQVVAFNDGTVSGHDPATGTTLWERPWGNGNVVCAAPVVVSSNRVLFSSGYGVGAELLEISQSATGKFSVKQVWKSIRMKAKFAHLFARDGFLYGLDDGIFACVDLQNGSQRWKEGRYGHGQGLLVGELYLLMAESGELVLLRPTPEAPNEIARHRVFDSKTWNPIALAGDLLLVRNDREAACLRLKLAP